MIPIEKMTPAEIQRLVFEVLVRELGPYGFVRFMQQFETGSGDYTAERHAWLDAVDEQALLRKLAQVRADVSDGAQASP